jgi:hypothetical protein
VRTAARERGVDVELAFDDEPASLAHGVLLEGERMSVEISPAALVGERREELRGHAAVVLFGDAVDAEA